MVAEGTQVRAPRVGDHIVLAALTASMLYAVLVHGLPGGPATAAAEPSGGVAHEMSRPTDFRANAGRQKALAWIGGLSNGLILPSDVARRLARQDPPVGAAVVAVWVEFQPIRHDEPGRTTAMIWLKGLAEGYLIPSDMRRLRMQQPEAAEVVAAAWRHLRAMED